MSFLIQPPDTSLPREQEARIERMQSEPLFIIDTVERVPGLVFSIAVSGSTANLYTVTIEAQHTPGKCVVSCTCPDGCMMAKFKRVKCKHACFVLLRLLRQVPEVVLREGALNHRDVAQPVLDAAQRACTIRNWESLTNREYQRVYEQLAASASSLSHLDVDVAALEEEDCAICLEPHAVDAREAAAQCLVCHKAFHRQCIDVWLACKGGVRQCPLCRGSWTTYTSAATSRPPKKRARSTTLPSSYINLGQE